MRGKYYVIAVVVILGALLLGGFYYFLQSQSEFERLQDATIAYEKGDFDAALRQTEEILAKEPTNENALLVKASTLAQKGSLQFQEETYGAQAIAITNQVIAQNPRSAEAHRVAGYSFEIMQEYGKAHAEYAAALAINPRDAAVISQDAHAYDLEGKAAEAKDGYQRALLIDPNLWQAHMGLGRMFVKEGSFDGALGEFKLVAENAQNTRLRAEAAYSAGLLIAGKGDYSGAENTMRWAIQIDKTYPLAWTGLANMLFTQITSPSSNLPTDKKKKFLQESFFALETALHLNPNQTLARYQAAVQMAAFDAPNEALKELEVAKENVPNDITLGASEKASFTEEIDALYAYISSR